MAEIVFLDNGNAVAIAADDEHISIAPVITKREGVVEIRALGLRLAYEVVELNIYR